MSNLDRRIERLEQTLGDSGLPALITGWYEPLDPSYSRVSMTTGKH